MPHETAAVSAHYRGSWKGSAVGGLVGATVGQRIQSQAMLGGTSVPSLENGSCQQVQLLYSVDQSCGKIGGGGVSCGTLCVYVLMQKTKKKFHLA